LEELGVDRKIMLKLIFEI